MKAQGSRLKAESSKVKAYIQFVKKHEEGRQEICLDEKILGMNHLLSALTFELSFRLNIV
jgi:hypothetical protein